MKFTCTVDIDLNRKRVIELFDNPDNMQYWQDDFVSFQHKEGIAGSVGAKSIVKYKRVELIETIIKKDLPNELHGLYEGSWGKNTMNNYFESIGSNKTLWRAEVEFLEFNGLMMKIMKVLFPGVFKKQTQKWMDQFKVFSESQPK